MQQPPEAARFLRSRGVALMAEQDARIPKVGDSGVTPQSRELAHRRAAAGGAPLPGCWDQRSHARLLSINGDPTCISVVMLLLLLAENMNS